MLPLVTVVRLDYVHRSMYHPAFSPYKKKLDYVDTML